MNDLQLFYAAYWDWVMSGAPDGKPFNRGHGLCGCLLDWAIANGKSPNGMKLDMVKQFTDAKMDPVHPFNDTAHQPSFAVESKVRRCHLNGARLNWVHAHK